MSRRGSTRRRGCYQNRPIRSMPASGEAARGTAVSRSAKPIRKDRLNVEVLDLQGVVFDEGAPEGDVFAHQQTEQAFGFLGFVDGDLQ